MPKAEFVPLETFRELPLEKMRVAAREFLETMRRRRTVREFSDRAVPRDVIEDCLLAAGTAPNGANRQPWRFVVVGDPETKAKIRSEAEVEERLAVSDYVAEHMDVAPEGQSTPPYLFERDGLATELAEDVGLGTVPELSLIHI